MENDIIPYQKVASVSVCYGSEGSLHFSILGANGIQFTWLFLFHSHTDPSNIRITLFEINFIGLRFYCDFIRVRLCLKLVFCPSAFFGVSCCLKRVYDWMHLWSHKKRKKRTIMKTKSITVFHIDATFVYDAHTLLVTLISSKVIKVYTHVKTILWNMYVLHALVEHTFDIVIWLNLIVTEHNNSHIPNLIKVWKIWE